MNKPKISIVMPSFNQGKYLTSAIASILDQSYPNLEFFIIDGGSTDESLSILKTHSKSITHWSSKPDNGQSDALNTGFSLCSGEIIGWLNSDDTYQRDTLSKVSKLFSDTTIDIAMCNTFGLMDSSGNTFDYKQNAFMDHKSLIRYWKTGGLTINQPSVFFRRKLIENFAPVLDPSLNYAMDYDLWLRITRNTDIRVVDGHWANYRFHDTSKSGLGFDDFLPEWYAVSKRYWGKKGSIEWYKTWINRQLYHYSKKLYYGVPKRLKKLVHE